MSHFNALILMGFLDYFTDQTNEEEVVNSETVEESEKGNKISKTKMKVERKIVDTDQTEEEEKETRPKKKQDNKSPRKII